MLPFHRIKNLGLALLIALQLAMGLLAFKRIAADREAITVLGEDLAEEMALLYQVERSLRLASNLFLFDLGEAYVPADGVIEVIDEVLAFAGRIEAGARPALQRELAALRPRCGRIAAGIAFYKAAEESFTSDHELLAVKLTHELGELTRLTGELSFLSELSPAERSGTAALYELSQTAQELFRRVQENAVHQPQVMVRLLRQTGERLERFYHEETEEPEQDPNHLQTVRQLQEHVAALRTNLPRVYRLWSWDPNSTFAAV